MTSLTADERKVLNTEPRTVIWTGLLTIVVFFGGLIAWSVFLPFYGAVVAPGTVKILQNKKTVQHLEGGIVDRIFVREGDEVKAGQVLMKLRDERIDANVALTQGHLWAKIALSARLRAESQLGNEIVWPQEMRDSLSIPEVVSAQKKENDVFVSRRRDMEGKISLHNAQIQQLYEQAEGAQAELNSQQEILRSLQQEIKSKKVLLEDKYIDQSQILELERRRSTAEGRAGSLRQSIAEGKQRIEELKLRIADLRNNYRENAISEQSKVTDDIFQLREQLRPVKDSKKRLEILSPVDGIVLNMQVHSESSAVIRPGEPLMDIVPKDSKLIIEARIAPTDIAHVYKEQHAEIMLPAFDRRITPRFPGKVDYVSADQLIQQTPAGGMSYYLVHIVVNEDALASTSAYLYPGMPAECYITTTERTILGYLLDPFLKMTDKALRER